MSVKKPFRFAGGKDAATVKDDTHRAIDGTTILLALCEGEIAGPVNQEEGIFIDGTPLKREGQGFNFEDLDVRMVTGASGSGFVAENETALARSTTVETNLEQNIPVSRELSGGSDATYNVDYLEMRFVINELHNAGKPDKTNNTVSIQITIKTPSETLYSQVHTFTGKITSSYPWEITIPDTVFADGGVYKNGPFTAEVKCLTATDSGQRRVSISWESFQEVLPAHTIYDTALLWVSMRATDQLSRFPEVYGIYRGLLCQVPDNYDPETRTYTGVWDGVTFQTSWTDNPVWCLREIIHNERFGLANYGPVLTNDMDFYEAAQWCDVMVPRLHFAPSQDLAGCADPDGTQLEPRFSLNLIISEPLLAEELLQFVAGSFHGVITRDNLGRFGVAVPQEDEPVLLFTKENITDQGFVYTFTEASERFTEHQVSYEDPEVDWEERRVRVRLPLSEDGVWRATNEIVAVGCTSRSEAYRRGWYRTMMSTYQHRTVQFQTNRYGLNLQPYDLICVVDDEVHVKASTGRIRAIPDTDQIDVGEFRSATLFHGNRCWLWVVDDTGSPLAGPIEVLQDGRAKDGDFNGEDYSEYQYLNLAEDLPGTVPVDATFVVFNDTFTAVSGTPSSLYAYLLEWSNTPADWVDSSPAYLIPYDGDEPPGSRYGEPFPIYRVMTTAEKDGDADDIEISAIQDISFIFNNSELDLTEFVQFTVADLPDGYLAPDELTGTNFFGPAGGASDWGSDPPDTSLGPGGSLIVGSAPIPTAAQVEIGDDDYRVWAADTVDSISDADNVHIQVSDMPDFATYTDFGGEIRAYWRHDEGFKYLNLFAGDTILDLPWATRFGSDATRDLLLVPNQTDEGIPDFRDASYPASLTDPISGLDTDVRGLKMKVTTDRAGNPRYRLTWNYNRAGEPSARRGTGSAFSNYDPAEDYTVAFWLVEFFEIDQASGTLDRVGWGVTQRRSIVLPGGDDTFAPQGVVFDPSGYENNLIVSVRTFYWTDADDPDIPLANVPSISPSTVVNHNDVAEVENTWIASVTFNPQDYDGDSDTTSTAASDENGVIDIAAGDVLNWSIIVDQDLTLNFESDSASTGDMVNMLLATSGAGHTVTFAGVVWPAGGWSSGGTLSRVHWDLDDTTSSLADDGVIAHYRFSYVAGSGWLAELIGVYEP